MVYLKKTMLIIVIVNSLLFFILQLCDAFGNKITSSHTFAYYNIEAGSRVILEVLQYKGSSLVVARQKAKEVPN